LEEKSFLVKPIPALLAKNEMVLKFLALGLGGTELGSLE
jgi:hypothetical protein